MPVVCPMQGCKEKKGMCIHDWMMLVMVIVVVGIIAKVLGWF
ncbi:hypothetical protein ACFLZ2_03900 [Candidatus Margulisiibacteriota bacterium]